MMSIYDLNFVWTALWAGRQGHARIVRLLLEHEPTIIDMQD